MFDHQLRQFGHLVHLPGNPNVSAVSVHQNIAAGNRHVFRLDGLGHVAKTDAHGLHLLHVQTDRHFPSIHAADVYFADFREVLNLFLQVFRVLVELSGRVIARKVDVLNGHQFGEFEL